MAPPRSQVFLSICHAASRRNCMASSMRSRKVSSLGRPFGRAAGVLESLLALPSRVHVQYSQLSYPLAPWHCRLARQLSRMKNTARQPKQVRLRARFDSVWRGRRAYNMGHSITSEGNCSTYTGAYTGTSRGGSWRDQQR